MISARALAAALMLTSGAALAGEVEPLPEGNTGIASRYPLDAGISGDAKVDVSY